VSGAPEVNLYASTSGSDSDWVVKLIDVYPDTVPSQPAMGGYELPISLDIFRGRYRTSFEHPEAITPDKPLLYRFGLPTVNHVFAGAPHHGAGAVEPVSAVRPQSADVCAEYFDAKPEDYQKATQRIWHTPG
jgi:predicted acyl esterase